MKIRLRRSSAILAASLLALSASSLFTYGATTTVLIQGFAFVPATVSINTGDTVTWVQKDTIGHTTTSDDATPLWNSPLLSVGQDFSFTFSSAGTFAYHCIPHASFMKGSVTVQGTATNVPPTVQITAPADGSVLTDPASVMIVASAADTDGSVTQVEFFDGAASLGVVSSAPYNLTVNNLAVGPHSLTAKATDNLGAATVSAAVAIQVNGVVTNATPTVQITSPTNNTAVTNPATIALSATASDSDGSVAQVEFLDGTNSLGVVVTPPYSLSLTNLTDGWHQLTAKATDNQGATTTSSEVTLVVNTPSDTNQTVVIHNFSFTPKDLTINIGQKVSWVQADTVQHTSTSDATPPVWDSGLLDFGKDFSFSFNTPGTFAYHCIPHQANPNMHGTVTVLGTVTFLPVATLTSPGKGAVFMSPADITLQATASETNGTIDHVEFFAGTNSLGVASQKPYTLTWSNVTPGLYMVSVRAFDTTGADAASPATPVTVTEAAAYLQHNLVSDLAGLADHTDTNLVNPWGLAFSATSPFWIADNHSGLATLYDTTGAVQTLVVTIPAPAGSTNPGAPTGQIFNGTTNFVVASNSVARFIFSTEDGTIAAWSSGSNAVLKADRSAAGAIYKGLALASANGSNFLYATDFHNGKVDVFDADFQLVTLAGSFSDPTIPAGFAPFGIETVGGNLYVTYAKQDADAEDDVSGPGNGFVNVFDTSGNMVKRFASNGSLNSPWGIAMAPAGFGTFSGNLLIGNFGDGRVNVFDPSSGAMVGTLMDSTGNAISIQGLWAIKFGNNARGGDGNRLYFTAGIAGGGSVEDHGLFGSISAQPVMQIMSITDRDPAVAIEWVGGTGPYLLQQKASLSDSNWVDVLTTPSRSAVVPKTGPSGFFRVLDNAPGVVVPFSVLLTASNEVPATASSAIGVGLLSLSGSNLTYQITYNGLSGDATAAHIHGPADATQPAGVEVPLPGVSGTSGVLAGTAVLTADLIAQIASGNTYVNIHTPANKGGEIRGQIVPLRIPIKMDGASEVGPVNTPGTASGWLSMIGNHMIYEINYGGLTTNATAAHIHGPAATTNSAGVLFPLAGVSGTAGTLAGSHTLSQSELTNLLAGTTYANIHTANNPGGEIRGQIMPLQFGVNMSNAAEVPASPVTSTGTGTGTLWLAGGTLNYHITYSGLTGDASAAHIHGPADTSHPAGVLFPLVGAAGPSGTLVGSAVLTSDQVASLLTGFTYANVHTAANPGGEIRGQVVPSN